MKTKISLVFIIFSIIFTACKTKSVDKMNIDYKQEVDKYFEYKLTANISSLSENQKQMLPLLFKASEIIDQLYWEVACGPYQTYYDSISDENEKKLFKINYGPWDRLNGNKPFVKGVGKKPLGAFFYPVDMTKKEFEDFNNPTKKSLYTIIKRDESGNLISVPYHIAFKEKLQMVADLLRQASTLADNEGFKKYLNLRADALLTDNYIESDMAWMDMKDNVIDFVIGPIENYEDALFEYKAAFEAYILIKDMKWSKMLEKYAKLLPKLQKQLPVPDEYKKEEPGLNSQLNAYDVVYYAGDCNAGSKTIAINLPNDEKVQLAKGSRRLQLKNAMKAKFDNIVVPIGNVLIDADQRKYITFDAFFANTMFHEVAHGLGIKNTLDGSMTCRDALKERYSTFEEGKADILGIWLINELLIMNEFKTNYLENQVTFAAGIFRSIRFGAASSHAKANLIRYNFFMEQGAMERKSNGTYTVIPEKMQIASDSLARLIIQIQGDGDYDKAGKIMDKYMITPEVLKKDLAKLEKANIPVDVKWIQGVDVLIK